MARTFDPSKKRFTQTSANYAILYYIPYKTDDTVLALIGRPQVSSTTVTAADAYAYSLLQGRNLGMDTFLKHEPLPPDEVFFRAYNLSMDTFLVYDTDLTPSYSSDLVMETFALNTTMTQHHFLATSESIYESFSPIATAATYPYQVEFGAKTLPGAGAYTFTYLGQPITNASITGGTITGAQLTSDGVLTFPSETPLEKDGMTIIVTCDQAILYGEVKVIPDAYSFVPNAADYIELGNILNLGWPNLSGDTIIGRAGKQLIDERYFNMYPDVPRPFNTVTFTSHNIDRRPRDNDACLDLDIIAGPVNWSMTRSIKFYRVKWTSNWEPGVSTAGGHVILSSDYGFVTWEQCNINGNWRTYDALYGPAYTGLDYTYRGFIYGQNGANPAGPVSLIDNDIHDFWRAFQIDINAPNCKIIGNDIHHCAVDHGVITRNDIKDTNPNSDGITIAWNTFHDPIVLLPPEMNVVSIDPATDRISIEDPLSRLLLGATLNFSDSTEVLPTGLVTTKDLTTEFVSNSNGITTLKVTNFNFIDTGTNCVVRMEPSHADFLQGVMNPDAPVQNIHLIGNVIYGDPKSEVADVVGWPQGIFLEDIAAPDVNNYYDDLIVAGNIVYTKVLHGVSIYNPRRAIIADNTTIAPPGTVQLDELPRVSIRQQWFAVGEDNMIINNIAAGVSSYISSDYVPTTGAFQNTIMLPPDYFGSDEFYNARPPGSIHDLIKRYSRKDLAGMIDYDTRTYDLPSINYPGYITIPSVTNAPNGQTITSNPILVDSIEASDGSPSVRGALIFLNGGKTPEYRITSDEEGLNVITDWNSTAGIIQNNQYLWLRDVASGNIQVTRVMDIRIGKSLIKWSITSGDTDVGAPELTNLIVFNKYTTSADFKFTTDEATGTAYYLLSPNSIVVANDVIANGVPLAITQAGVQPTVNLPGLQQETPYYIHVVHVDAVGNVSEVSSASFLTTPTPIYYDDFLTDTSANYTAPGTIEYSAIHEALIYTSATENFGGISTPAIAVTPGERYTIEIAVANETSAGIVDAVIGTTVGGQELISTSTNVYGNTTGVIKLSVTPTVDTIYVTTRFRGTGAGRNYILLSLSVLPGSNGIDPYVDNDIYGQAFYQTGSDIAFFDNFDEVSGQYYASGTLEYDLANNDLIYYTSGEGFEPVIGPAIDVVPGQEYIAEVVMTNPAGEGQADLVLGRTPGNNDLGESVVRAGARQTSTCSIVFTAPVIGKVYAAPRFRTGDAVFTLIIHGMRVSKNGMYPPLTLQDVS